MPQYIRSFLYRFVIPFIFIIAMLILTYQILFYRLGFRAKLDLNFNESKQNTLSSGQKVLIGLKARELDFNEPTSVVLEPFEEGIINHLNIPLVVASLDYIEIASDFLSSGEKLCFQKLNIEHQGIGSFPQKLIDPTLSNGIDLCFGSGRNIIIGEPTAKLIYNRYDKDYLEPYQYPFDSRSLTFLISIDAYIQNESNDKKFFITLKDVEFSMVPTDKEVWLLDSKISDKTIELKTTMSRHPNVKALTLLVLGAWIAVIMVLPLITNIDNFWDAIGGLIGLIGIQSLLIPDYIHTNIIIRDFLLRIYLLIPLMILIKYCKNVWEKNLPYAKPLFNPRNTSGNIDSTKLATQILAGSKDENIILEWAEQQLVNQMP